MFTAIARYFRGWKSYDKAMQELSYLTDRELADIGISRCDIPRLAREHSVAEMAMLSLPPRRSDLAPYVRSPGLQHMPAKTACFATKLPA